MSNNRGKQGITLNLKHPRSLELMRGLVAKVDVVVHNFLHGWIYRVGLDYDSLKAINPKLIYCWLSAYGEDGPYGDKGALDLMVMGLGGAMSVTGQPDGPPVKSSISYGDILSGHSAALGIVAALRVRDRTGVGQQVSTNLLDSAMAPLGALACGYFATGNVPGRTAPDSHPSLSTSGAYRTSDGYMNISATTDREFPRLCGVLGLDHLAEDPEFATNPDRVRNREQLRETIEGVLATKTTSEWVAFLSARQVMAEPVNTVKEAFEHPQVVHNQMKQTLQHPTAGPVSVLRMPIRMSQTPLTMQGPPPRLGEHTREVLARYLDIGDEKYAQLRQEGVV
jgi:crotonobetainyl-CoA:carnitine CoA-transferase CaiB-like acyl-CoA transferase